MAITCPTSVSWRTKQSPVLYIRKASLDRWTAAREENDRNGREDTLSFPFLSFFFLEMEVGSEKPESEMGWVMRT